MSTEAAMTMQDLELEHAELLPSRETLCCSCRSSQHGSSFTQVGSGNTPQSGFINASALNGDLNNDFSVGSGNIL